MPDSRAGFSGLPWLLLLLLLLFAAGCDGPAGQAAASEARRVPLEALLLAEGEILFAGLFALADTRAAFTAAAPEDAWGSHHPQDIARQLDAAERHAVLSAVAAQLAEPGAWDAFTRSWRRWLLAWRQYEVFTGLYHGEGFMAAAFDLPATRALFDDALERRGLAPDAVPPEQVGATLASGEHAEVLYRWLAAVAALKPEEQVAYHQAFYARLVVLAGRI